MSADVGLVWFKTVSLRLADNAALAAAHAAHARVAHLVVLEPAAFGGGRLTGLPRAGSSRAVAGTG